MSPRNCIRFGAISGFLAVALGAFGAHMLKTRLSEPDLAIFETGVRYQMYHALALLAVGLVATRQPRTTALAVASWCFLVGTLVFSGSLYALALLGIRWLGAITPLGGIGFLVGWGALAFGVRPVANERPSA